MKTPRTTPATPPAEASVPFEYMLPHPDCRVPLMRDGHVMGQFVNPTLAAQSRRFLERLSAAKAGKNSK